ncbi:MAG: hypothetical protein H0W40_14580 [Methylibium sp.]|uniref:hypothetical protein n=1 Tax=Methylibium sp. TaxID=2067992 RepID=UPI00181ADFD5|nr:hypothetical protein [Methylibium sp.]MBA3598583.1 hypothetical protein [Methylibium sp.]
MTGAEPARGSLFRAPYGKGADPFLRAMAWRRPQADHAAIDSQEVAMLVLAAHRFYDNATRAPSIAALARERCAARAQGEPAPERVEPGTGGWFESSQALRKGLTVVEHHSRHGDTLEIAVALWLH